MEEVIGILLYLDLTSDPKQKVFFHPSFAFWKPESRGSRSKLVVISQDIVVNADKVWIQNPNTSWSGTYFWLGVLKERRNTSYCGQSLFVFPVQVCKEKHTSSTPHPPPTKKIGLCLSFKFSYIWQDVTFDLFQNRSTVFFIWSSLSSLRMLAICVLNEEQERTLRPETWVGFWFHYLPTVWPPQARSALDLFSLICKIRVKNRCILRLLELVKLCTKYPAYSPEHSKHPTIDDLFLFTLFTTKLLVKVVKFTKWFHRILRGELTEWVKYGLSLQIRSP